MRDVHSDEVRAPALRMEGFEGEWSETTLGNLAESFSYGLNAPAGPYDGKTKYLRITDIDEDSRRYNQQSVVSPVAPDDEVEKYLLEHDDLLLARAASVGRSFHVSGDYGRTVYAGYLIRVRLLETASPLFVFYYTLTGRYWDYIRSTSQRSSQAGVNAREYADLPVFLPGSSEQLSVAGVFEAADSVMEGVRQQVELLTSLKMTMLVKMFPQGTASTPEVRFEGFEGDWGTRSLGELGSIKTGPFGSTLHAEDYVSHGTPIITTEHFKTGNLTTYLPTLPQVSAKDRARLAGYSLTEGDIVFSRVGSVDVNAVVSPEHEGWLFSGRVLRVRLETEVDYEYLHWCLLTPVLREDITSRAVGQTMPSINTRILADTVVPVPSLPEQQAIGAYFRSLDALIEAEQKKLDTLRNLKSALLTQMFV
mgnify:CR=1 FL=1